MNIQVINIILVYHPKQKIHTLKKQLYHILEHILDVKNWYNDLRDNPAPWQIFSSEMAEMRGPTKHLLLRPAVQGNLFVGRRGRKKQSN